MEIQVVSAARQEQTARLAASNITVITSEMIENRGYRNLVEILEDLPGFDFATYEDGGGEYPNHALNRGIGGDAGNSKMLVMVDNIVQNHVSFNWANGLTDEQILHDVERVEVVQGPGSSLYGANALSGIIHIITKKNYKGFYIKPWIGRDNTRVLDMMYGGSKGELNYQIALHSYQTDGDMGKERPDPGNYFHNNVEPFTLTQDYDGAGNYQTNVANASGGTPIENGFNTEKDDISLRLKISNSSSELGFFYWEKKDGLGSYVPGYEYDATNSNFIVHHRGYHIYLKNDYELSSDDSANLTSTLWYRVNEQLPDTGFEYTYRFPGLKKSYHSNSNQVGIEEQLNIKLGDNHKLVAGGRYMMSRKMEQVVSLGAEQASGSSYTDSSWNIASGGGGLGQKENVSIYVENEYALYGLFEGKVNEKLKYSMGGRYDHGSDYGGTTNPRAGLVRSNNDFWTTKLMYGTAYRQPSLFELHDEHRHNVNLAPEKIDTYELENNFSLTGGNTSFFDEAGIKINLFYSELEDTISTVPDASRAGGLRYDNIDKSKTRGLSTQIDVQVTKKLSLYMNYIFTEGKEAGANWGDMDNVAKNKINAGLNWLTFSNHLNVNVRTNYVGRRKVPDDNAYFTDYAPGYTKTNLTLTCKNCFGKRKIEPQLIVKNVFDKEYFGVGRQQGNSDRTLYDPVTNPNPPGFIPPYHPQPGRTFYFNVRFIF